MTAQRLLAAVLIATAAAAATAQDTAYSVKGIAPAGVRMMYLFADGDTKADSAEVSGGTFAFSGTRPANALLALTDKRRGWHLFNDGTPVDIDLNRMTIKASPLNEKLFAVGRTMDSIDARGMALYAEFEQAQTDRSETGRRRQAELSRSMAALSDTMSQVALRLIRANRDNLIPVSLISTMARQFDLPALRSVLDPAAPYYSHPALDWAKRLADNAERALGNRRPGLQFSDISLPDTTGTVRRLSEWCGRGGYVLIDFWASWCGPCRMEMPNVVANYSKYRSKGFCVVGISLDSNAEAWKKSIAAMQMEWPQLSDLKGWNSDAAALYSVRSIPASILVDGSGKIVAADLRGSRLGDKLKEIYGF